MRRLVSRFTGFLALAAGLTVFPGIASATFYAGPGTANGGGGDGTAITGVAVTNDNSNIYFTINSTEAEDAYTFYEVELQIAGQPVGDTSLTNNPYTAPNVGISTGVNSLLDTYGNYMQGGYDAYTWSGTSWTHQGGTLFSAGGTGNTSATLTVPLSELGLSIGSSFLFDVVSSYTNPVGQGAYGALDSTGYPAETNGSYNPYTPPVSYDSAMDANSTFNSGASRYTVTAVPEPASLGLLCVSGLMLGMRRRRMAK
jgi:hypothetical protein